MSDVVKGSDAGPNERRCRELRGTEFESLQGWKRAAEGKAVPQALWGF
jgi:hypothetical protein